MNNRKQIFLFTALFAFVSFSLFMLAVIYGWFGPSADVGGAFCEAARPGLIKQPANTWSNLGFIAAGLLMAFQLSQGAFHENINRFTQSNFTAIFFSCIVVFLGPGSMAMHATETGMGGEFDMLSMYLIASFAASYAMQRFFGWRNITFTIWFISIIIFCEVVGLYHEHIPIIDYAGNAVFALFITLTVIFEMLYTFTQSISHERKFGFASLGSLLLAFAIWNMWKDDSPLCDPQSLIQGHAIWHLLDALAAYFLFRFYASEHKEYTNQIMARYLFVLTAFLFAGCGTKPAQDVAQTQLPQGDSAATILNVDSLNADEADDTTNHDYETYFIVIADTGIKYPPLQSKMYALSRQLNIPIDTMGRHYNETKNLIALADDDEDEMYAGDYYPRRDISEHLSLEYLNFYQPDAGDKTIALVAGIYETEKSADSSLAILKRADTRSFKIKADVYVGCMH